MRPCPECGWSRHPNCPECGGEPEPLPYDYGDDEPNPAGYGPVELADEANECLRYF